MPRAPLQLVRAAPRRRRRSARAVHFVLARPGLFLNSSSDATLLRPILTAAGEAIEAPADALMEADVAAQAMEPLFTVGGSDAIGMAGF